MALVALAGGSAAWPAGAQVRRGKPLVSMIANGALDRQPFASFVEGLRELGYADGRNIELGKPIISSSEYAALSRLAADAVAKEADVVVAFGASATKLVIAATKTIPIVMMVNADPVELGFVKSLARPGGNVTGLSMQGHVLAQKQVELLKELVPRMKRLGVLFDPSSTGQPTAATHVAEAASRIGVSVQRIPFHGVDGIKRMPTGIANAKPDALFLVAGTLIFQFRDEVLRAAAASKLPAVYGAPGWVQEGGLISYGVDYRAQLRRAAYFVDRILKGARPADLPVEQPTKFYLAVNLKTAKALGITVPQSVFVRADEVIE